VAIEDKLAEPTVGTVLRNPATGDVATRVNRYGERYWRVKSVDDRSWTEFDRLDGWDVLHAAAEPAEETDADTEVSAPDA